MAHDTGIRTATMAKIYAAQGHYDLAAEIYRDLLQAEPGRHDLAQALAEVEKIQQKKISDSRNNLAPLLGKWVKLLLRYRQMQDLEKIKRGLSKVRSTRLKSD